jgi:hypothetical protein
VPCRIGHAYSRKAVKNVTASYEKVFGEIDEPAHDAFGFASPRPRPDSDKHLETTDVAPTGISADDRR